MQTNAVKDDYLDSVIQTILATMLKTTFAITIQFEIFSVKIELLYKFQFCRQNSEHVVEEWNFRYPTSDPFKKVLNS